MNEIKFAQVTGMTSPNPLTLVCTKKADGDESETPLFAWKGYAEVAPAVKA